MERYAHPKPQSLEKQFSTSGLVRRQEFGDGEEKGRASQTDGELRPGNRELGAYCPAAAAPPRTTFTSAPLPTPSNCAAAVRFAAISRNPMLPRIPNTSPGAPCA